MAERLTREERAELEALRNDPARCSSLRTRELMGKALATLDAMERDFAWLAGHFRRNAMATGVRTADVKAGWREHVAPWLPATSPLLDSAPTE